MAGRTKAITGRTTVATRGLAANSIHGNSTIQNPDGRELVILKISRKDVAFFTIKINMNALIS